MEEEPFLSNQSKNDKKNLDLDVCTRIIMQGQHKMCVEPYLMRDSSVSLFVRALWVSLHFYICMNRPCHYLYNEKTSQAWICV